MKRAFMVLVVDHDGCFVYKYTICRCVSLEKRRMVRCEKLAGTLSGGWGFNVWQKHDERAQEWKSVRYSPAGAVAAIADGSIMNRPVFDVSDATELMNPNATEDDVFLALAKHVPALSHPVGGNRVLRPDRQNFDLNSSDYRNRWGRTHKIFGDSWLHSDMKDMAYFYVYKLYDEIFLSGSQFGRSF